MYGSLRKNNGIRQHGISLFTDHYDHDSGNHRRGKSTACRIEDIRVDDNR